MKQAAKLKVFASYLGMVMLLWCTNLSFRALIIHSNFSLDFDNILNCSIASYVYMGCILLLGFGILQVGLYHNRWVRRQGQSTGFRLVSILVSTVLILSISRLLYTDINYLWNGLCLLSFSLLIDLFINPREKNLTWLISWTAILAAFLSFILFDAHLDYDLTNRERIARSMYHQVSERAVEDFNAVQERLKQDGNIAQFLTVPQPFKIHRSEFNQVNDHILDPSQGKMYDYIFNAFNRDGEAMINESYTAPTYYELFKKKSDTIDQGAIFFDPIRNTYLTQWVHEIENDSLSPYTIYLEQYPTGSHVNRYKQLGKYDYAFYRGNELASHSNPFILDYEDTRLDVPYNGRLEVRRDNYNDLYVQLDATNRIKLSRRSAQLIKPLSLFSMLFIYSAILLGLFTLINMFRVVFPSYFTFKLEKRNSLKHTLQGAIIGLILFSFLVIGVVTIMFFQNLSSAYDKDLLKEKAYALALDIESRKRNLADDELIDAFGLELSYMVREHNAELNLFLPDGQLKYSTVPKVYEKGLQDDHLNEDILTSFKLKKEQLAFDFDMSFMGLEYQHVYLPIYNAQNELAFVVQNLQVPATKTHSKVSDFVGTLLNIYVFLFLIAGILALIVSHSITQPIKVLGTKLKKVKLGSKNERLTWESKDEIGQLVNNYNDMVVKLEDSVKLIALNERDTAWREMAKQVAHEIKNPLTPMKLSIQYLQRTANGDPDRTKQMIERVSTTLIEQIDSLSEIAGAFSNFGKMPTAENEKIVLNDVLQSVHDLFRKREDIDITMYEPIDELYVFADRTALVRILNNLVKNAIQAIPPDREGKIDIHMYKEDRVAKVRISDNGVGISEDRKSKVFLPNFTTKNSGTGLGLAMCANMVEAFNGKLYFESELGQGTDFYLEVPLMHVNDNFIRTEHVML